MEALAVAGSRSVAQVQAVGVLDAIDDEIQVESTARDGVDAGYSSRPMDFGNEASPHLSVGRSMRIPPRQRWIIGMRDSGVGCP
jgi:hypothetical protein